MGGRVFDVVIGGLILEACASFLGSLPADTRPGGNAWFAPRFFEQSTFCGGFLALHGNNSVTQLEFVQNFATASGAERDNFCSN